LSIERSFKFLSAFLIKQFVVFKNQKSKIKNQKSKIKNQKSKIKNQLSIRPGGQNQKL
jgi:hypothetical protein